MTSPDQRLEDLGETYREKNDDYGDSWRLTGHIMHQMTGGQPVRLETPEDWIRVGLYVRRLDKFLRAFHGEFIAEDGPNFEAIQDSHEDEAVYAAMHASTHGDDDE